MRYKVTLDCKTNHVGKDGKFPILLRVYINGKHNYINIGERIKAEHYDKENNKVKSGVKGSQNIEEIIDRHYKRITDILREFDRKEEIATFSQVKELYQNVSGNGDSISFKTYVEEKIKRERELKEISPDTLDNYDSQLIKLNTKHPNLSIHEVTTRFIENYKNYIKNELKQSKNTAYHAMCFLRKYSIMLFKEGKIQKNPFDNFVVGSAFVGEGVYLDDVELSSLHDLYDSKELLKIIKPAKSKYAKDSYIGVKYQEVLRYYLAACYCGLRHSDIKTFKTNEIDRNYIVKELKKGRKEIKKKVRILINERLLSLLDLNSKSGLVFEKPVKENAQSNKHLKQIAKIAGINKHLTFHTSRHTFAINSLLLGVSIEVVCDVLGHSD
ncbi:MAG TPA: tyrosine-type recombinase/integrase [Bacteroidia bacterium]|jgi:integrase|nr:tyrosine-type recombinase/integrase [Bacteroidia bacterium]